MKKFVTILVSLLILGLFVLLAWWLYRSFHSTPMLIANLFIILTGVLTSITFYVTYGNDSENTMIIEDEEYPPIETGLIYAQTQDFVNKYEKKEGSVFIAGIDTEDKKFKLENITYDKLVDEISLSFSPSLKISLKGVSTIAVGDNQFLIHGFEVGSIDYDKTYKMDWRHDKLMLTAKKKKPVQLKIPHQKPTILFDWT